MATTAVAPAISLDVLLPSAIGEEFSSPDRRPSPSAPQVFKKCRDHKLCDSKALIGAYTAVPKSTMYFLSNPPTPCPPNRAEPRHLPPVAELTQRRESSVIATRSDPNALFP